MECIHYHDLESSWLIRIQGCAIVSRIVLLHASCLNKGRDSKYIWIHMDSKL